MVHAEPFRHPPLLLVVSHIIFFNQSMLLLRDGGGNRKRAALHAFSTTERNLMELLSCVVFAQRLEHEFREHEGVLV